MKSTHLRKRIVAALLAVVLAVSLAAPSLAIEETGVSKSGSNGLTWEEIDSSSVQVESPIQANTGVVEKTVEHEDTDMVRVSIILKDASTLEKGFTSDEIAAADRSAMQYRRKLEKQQDSMAAAISKQALNGATLDVVWNMTLAANIISANVQYGQIEKIKEVAGVQEVILENRYEPCVVKQEETADPNMATSDKMIGSSAAWAAGYTGAGSRIAIIDTGADVDHPSLDPDALKYALQGSNATIMTEADLTDEVLNQLNAYTRKAGLTAADFYVNEKIPFGFNYVDADTDITHDNDTQGDHGSHVTGIAAGNRFVKDEAGNYVAALDSVMTQGVAPDAQILTMKVFGKRGGAYDSDYMVAIEDAMVLGADAANLSLGGSFPGYSEYTEEKYRHILDEIVGSGMVVTISAGNSGSWFDQTAFGLPYAGSVNWATNGSPGSYVNSLCVASVDNAGVTDNYLKVKGHNMTYTEKSYQNKPIYTIGGSHEYIYLDKIGTAEEFAAVKDVLAGKIAICNRGDTSFYEKAEAAVANGAIATIIVNNQPGSNYMDLTDYKKTEPCVSISQTDGAFLRKNSTKVTSQDGSVLYYSGEMFVSSERESWDLGEDYYTMSSFSSWGIPGALTMKPEITAPGGRIYSLKDGGEYQNMSGTSMASPQVAGMAALVAEYIKQNDLAEKTGLAVRTLAQSLLMSTAQPIVEKQGVDEQGKTLEGYYSVLQQGAGLANIGAAVNSGSYLMMDQDATDSYADGKIKAELGDDPQRTGEYSFGFTLYNLENTDSTFTLSADFFTQAALQGELNNGNGQVMNFSGKKTAALAADVVWDVDGKTLKPEMPAELDGCDFDGSGKVTADDGQALLDYVTGVRTEISGKSCADLDKDGDIDTYDAYLFFSRLSSAAVTVPANGKIHVTIHAKVLGLDSYDEKNGGAGAYVEGYVFANEVSSKEGVEGTSHSIPVLGYYGNWTDASMFDVGSFIQYHYGMETRPPYMLAAIQQAAQLQSLTIKYKGVDDSYSLGGNLYVDDGFYDADRYSINPDTAKISDIYFCLIRNAANGRITVTGEDGTVYLNKETQAPIIGAYYFSNQKTWMQVQSGLSVDCAPDAAEGEKLTVKLTMAPEYYVDYSGSTLSTDWDALGEGASQTYTMFVDKTAPTLTDITLSEDLINDGRVMTVTASDNRYVAAAVLYDYSTGKILARTGGSPKGASRGEAVTMSLDANGTANAAHLLLQVYDYANNCSTYKINLNKSELNDPVEVSLNRSTLKLFKGGTATLEAEVTPFGIHPDTVTWTSDNTNVATVDEDGTVTGIGDGTATITATSVKDPTKSAACTVTVEVLKVTLTGALMDGSSTSQFYTWDMENDTTWTPGAVMEVEGITSTAYDTDRNNVIVVDGNERKLHQVDMESGKVLADYDAVAGGNFNVPLFDLEYSELFTKGDVPACYSIYNFMLNKPAELGSIRTDGFMLFMDFLLYGNGADKFTAMTSLGKTKLDLDQDGTAETDAEVLLLLDNRGNVWTFQIYDGIDYSSTTGKYEIAKSNLTSAFKMYFMGDDNGTPLCSMVPTTVNGQLALYLSYFTGKANELYRLTYDSAKNFWTGEKLASFGENVYPATILKIDNHEANQTELEQIVSNLPLGSHTVQTQDLTDMLNSAAVEEAAASYGALNTAAEKTASAKPAADIAGEQPASSEIITSEDQNTVTLKLVPGGTAPTTNGLMSVSYDAAGWELKNVIGNAQYFSYKAEAGKVTLGYVSVDSMPAGEQVAELTFTKTNAGKDADPRFTVQKTERNEQQIDEVEHLTASSNRDDPCPSKEFRDLSTTAWYHESVDYVLSKGIMQGYGDGTFRPDETATRAQVVTLLYRIAGEPAADDSKALPFTDVNLESWYGSALRWAYQNGITTGVSADAFAPDDCVTREQLVSFLARYAKVTGAYEKVSEDLSSFSDRDRVSSYAVESMQWAVANGFILGTETGKLEPMATATRAQLAAVVARYCQSIH